MLPIVVSRVTTGLVPLAAGWPAFAACPSATPLMSNPIRIAAEVNPFLLSMLDSSFGLLPAHCIRTRADDVEKNPQIHCNDLPAGSTIRAR
jgi:hypothetical protein